MLRGHESSAQIIIFGVRLYWNMSHTPHCSGLANALGVWLYWNVSHTPHCSGLPNALGVWLFLSASFACLHLTALYVLIKQEQAWASQSCVCRPLTAG